MLDKNRTSRSVRALALATLAAGTVFLGSPRAAHAEEVTPDGKGIVGGALLGGEVVVFIEALAGVRSGTGYLLGAAGGAVAGGVGGYFVEKAVDDGRVPAYMLAGGLALIIPAIVVTLDQTRYLPAEGAREDRPVNAPPSDPGKPGGGAVIGAEPTPPPAGSTPSGTPASGTTPAPAPAPAPTPAPPAGGGGGGTPAARGPQARTQAPSLLNLQGISSFRVGVPVPEVRPVFSASQKRAFGVESAGSEVRFPVMNVTF